MNDLREERFKAAEAIVRYVSCTSTGHPLPLDIIADRKLRELVADWRSAEIRELVR